MDYNNIISDDGFYLYKDDSFNTIKFQMFFQRKEGNFEDAVFALLCKYLEKTNKNYKTELELNRKKCELYAIDYAFSTVDIGSVPCFYYCGNLVSPTVVHDDYSKEAFEFLRQVFYEPDFTKEDVFKNIKEVYLSFLLSSLNNQNIVAKSMYQQMVLNDKNNKFKYSTDEEYIKEMINKVTLKDLEKMYNETIKQENFLRMLVFGNITFEEFKEFRNKFNYKDNNKEFDYHKNYNIEEKDIELSSKTTSESIIYITYSIDDIDEKTRKILYEIFNGSGDLSSTILREKYGLVYSSSFLISYTGKYIILKAKIDKKNKQKLIDSTEEIINMIKDKKCLKDLLINAKEAIKKEYYLLSEDNSSMINYLDDYIGKIYGDFNDLEFVKNIDSYDVEDILKYTKTIKRKNVFMYRGDRHE